MVNIEQKLLTNSLIRPAIRSNGKPAYNIRELRGVVIHYTANFAKGAGIDAHYRYFNNPDNWKEPSRYASAHNFVENDRAAQFIPDDEVAYHCGDNVRPGVSVLRRIYLLRGIQHNEERPNYYTIGIEMCVNEGSDFQKTMKTAAQLCAMKLIEHNLTIQDLFRHFDVSGKICPAMFAPKKVKNKWDESAWLNFQTLVKEYIKVLKVS